MYMEMVFGGWLLFSFIHGVADSICCLPDPLACRSKLMYDYEEAVEPRFRLEDAMALYGLTDFELLWERASDTKALLSWGGSDLVVLSFRGTASMANVLADLQVGPPYPCMCIASMSGPSRGNVAICYRMRSAATTSVSASTECE